MLPCPWLLSILYNSLRTIFLRTRLFFLFNALISEKPYWAQSLLTWLNGGKERVEGEICPNNKSMFRKKKQKKIVFKEERTRVCSPHSDSGLSISILNNPWAIMMLLYATHDLLLHLLLHHQSFRGQRVFRETVLGKLKLLLFSTPHLLFPLLINCFQTARRIHLQTIFYLQLLGGQCDVLSSWYIHPFIQTTHDTRFARLFTHINLNRVSRCVQYFLHAPRKITEPDAVYCIYCVFEGRQTKTTRPTLKVDSNIERAAHQSWLPGAVLSHRISLTDDEVLFVQKFSLHSLRREIDAWRCKRRRGIHLNAFPSEENTYKVYTCWPTDVSGWASESAPLSNVGRIKIKAASSVPVRRLAALRKQAFMCWGWQAFEVSSRVWD